MSVSFDDDFFPFGLPACEDEISNDSAEDSYQDLYLRDTPFDSQASSAQAYLIVGRRGSGKTALAQSFRFSPRFGHPLYVFCEAKDYNSVLHQARHYLDKAGDFDLWRLTKLWEYAIWSLIGAHIQGESAISASASLPHILRGILRLFIEEESDIEKPVNQNVDVEDIKRKALAFAQKRTIIIAIDTLERYSILDTGLLKAISALIQFAKSFNGDFAKRSIHIKVLMSGEIYPHLEQSILDNPLKSVQKTVFLLWKPKPLLRLIAYRFHRFLLHNQIHSPSHLASIDWNDYEQVLKKAWNPYFGEWIKNGRGVMEHSFPYILRHTQMRPRQLIVLCNEVATISREAGAFPKATPDHIVEGVGRTEETLANEIINAYSQNFDNMLRILNSMLGCPMRFKANELDQRAWGIKKEWRLQEELGEFSSEAYKYVLAEMGIVGIVRRETEKFIEAEFEYSRHDRLHIGNDCECVIHPMFYQRLRVNLNSAKHVLPFSSELLGDAN